MDYCAQWGGHESVQVNQFSMGEVGMFFGTNRMIMKVIYIYIFVFIGYNV